MTKSSRIPVRRDLSLPSSGRSTPCSSTTPRHPPMQREGSSPPGLLKTSSCSSIGNPAKPKVPPKPKLSAPLLPSRGRPRESEGGSGRSTPSSTSTPSSRIPRPSNSVGIKKWDSTSCLEVGKVIVWRNVMFMLRRRRKSFERWERVKHNDSSFHASAWTDQGVVN